MNVAVNTRLLLKDKLEGIGWFSNETLKRITRNHPEHNFYFIFDRPYDPSFIFSDNITPIVVGPPTRHPTLWYFWMEYKIPGILEKIKADVFLSPDGFLSLKTKVPQVNVIHDINFAHNPHQLPFFTNKYYNYFFPRFAKKAKHIGTVSEYSKKDICNTYGIEESKITVCYNAANSIYIPLDEQTKNEVKEKYTNHKDYFIFVGALNPRKNIPGLLKSYELFRKSGNYSQKLVIVGSAMHLTQEINNTLNILTYKDDVIFTGRLNEKELHKVMGAALALVYIPFFEGFGIPLVEAMNCDVPIISGNTTSLPEVVGNAALISSPTDYKLVAKHMETIVNNKTIREDLIYKGRIQRTKFSWDDSAKKLWSCIEKAIK